MEVKVGQVYTFNDSETYDVIKEVTSDKIWYEIWQIGDLSYWDKETKTRVVWSKALPDNKGSIVDLEFMTPKEFEDLFNSGELAYGRKEKPKYLGEMNKDFGLDDEWHLVPINKATREWCSDASD